MGKGESVTLKAYIPLHVLIFLAFIASTIPVSVSALTLEEAIEHAVLENPEYKATQFLLKSSKHGVQSAFGGFLPEVSLNAQAARSEQKTDAGVKNKTHPKYAQLELSQTLFAGGAKLNTYLGEKARYNSLKKGELQSLQSLILQTVTAYMDVLREKDVYSLNENQVAVLQTQYMATKSRFDAGDLTKTDLKQAEARLYAAKAEKVRVKGALDSARFALKNILGSFDESQLNWPQMQAFLMPEQQRFMLNNEQQQLWNMMQSQGDIFSSPEVWNPLKRSLVESHPVYLSAQYELNAAGYDVKRSASSFMPNVNASLSYAKYDDVNGQDYDDKTAKLQLSLPLFRGGQTINAVRSVRALKDAARENLEKARRDVEQELVDAMRGYQTSLTSVDSYTLAYEAAKIASEGVRKEMDLGERSVLDFLQTEQDYLESAVNLESAKASVVVATFRFLMSMGALTSVISFRDEPQLMEPDLATAVGAEREGSKTIGGESAQ